MVPIYVHIQELVAPLFPISVYPHDLRGDPYRLEAQREGSSRPLFSPPERIVGHFNFRNYLAFPLNN
jgi:hypothetical protein